MRPSGETAQAAVNTTEAPPTAREPRCTRCQSLAKPSVLEYWHMGETTIRLRSFMSRICNSSNRFIGTPLGITVMRRLSSRPELIGAAMRFHVLAIGDGNDQADDVLACFRIESVHEDGVGYVVLADRFQFGIVDHHIAVVLTANRAAHLKERFSFRWNRIS